MDEREAIAACLAGGGEEFRTIVEGYKSQVMAMAMNVLGNRQDAEDVCQETFVQVYRHLSRYDQARSFRNWVFTILYRRCLDILKRQRRFRVAFRRISHDPGFGTSASFEDPIGRRDLARLVQTRLKTKERAALALWANEGLSSAEIAEVIGCAPSTARVYLFNARRKIKSLMEKNDVGAR
jgi:RNA polymerase sigma-70 factor (ECF subfamily)